MLFVGLQDAISRDPGQGAQCASGQVDVKCHAIGRAARIVDVGLKANLDLQTGGGPLAQDLADAVRLHGTLRLTQANLRNDAGRTRRACLALIATRARGLGLDRTRGCDPAAVKSPNAAELGKGYPT